MKAEEIVEAATNAWKRTKGKTVRKFRCKSGPRKGRVMASPASCNAPLKTGTSAKLKRTKGRLGRQGAYKSKVTRSRNPYSRRLTTLNKKKKR